MTPRPRVSVVVCAYNEESYLKACLHSVLAQSWPPDEVIVVNNASTDGTEQVGRRLETELDGVRYVRLEAKGRGRALNQVWSASDALVLAYMDVDLSTDLAALLPLVAPLVSGHSDLAIGSRLARGSRVVRGTKREVISRCYNVLLRGALRARFSDAQCGFKAIRADVARQLLPLVHDTNWFFDTELLVLAERAGLRIHEVPVDWVDDPDSRVDIVSTALGDLTGIARVGRALWTGALPLAEVRAVLGRDPKQADDGGEGGESMATARLTGQLVRFAVIGVASTLAYLIVYVLLRTFLGPQVANLLALLLTAVANTAANRRFTFGVSGRENAVTHQVQGLLVFGIALALTSGALWLLHALVPAPTKLLEVTVLVVANLTATLLRFLMLRVWVFRRR